MKIKKTCHLVKSEPTDVAVPEQEETVEGSTISTTSPILDPSVVPEGQGLVDRQVFFLKFMFLLHIAAV